MKQLARLILITMCLFLTVSSCVDKGYEWDELDKTGVLNIPPVMFGNIDTIYLEGLPEGIIPGGIPLPDFSLSRGDVIHGLFDGDAVRDFFFDGAATVEISAKADIDLSISGVTIELYFYPIDYDGNIMEDIIIAKQTLAAGKDQQLSIIVPSEYMRYMSSAKDLGLTVVLSAKDASIWIGEDDYIFIKNVIVKTGGYHIDF